MFDKTEIKIENVLAPVISRHSFKTHGHRLRFAFGASDVVPDVTTDSLHSERGLCVSSWNILRHTRDIFYIFYLFT